MWLQLAKKKIDKVRRLDLWFEGHTKNDGTIVHDSVKVARDRVVSHALDHIFLLILDVVYIFDID